MHARAALALALTWVLGCEDAGARHCQLGQERIIARSVALEYDAIELVALAEGPGGGRGKPARVAALWSDREGLFARMLDGDGAPTGEARRLGGRCAGGIDALPATGTAGGIDLACSSPDAPSGPGAGVVLYRLGSELAVVGQQVVAPLGPLSEGIAIAHAPRGVVLAWHDGAPDALRVVRATIAGGGAPHVEVVSDPGRMAAAPSLSVEGGRTRIAWAERWLERGELQSRVATWDGGGVPRSMLPVAHLQAMPQLLELDGRGLVAYRDRRGGGSRTGLYLTRVSDRGEPMGDPARVGRADGKGRPALVACMGGLVTATPRTYGGDYFVGVNWLDADLGKARGEQQFYEDAHAFSLAAAACSGRQAVILIAEYGDLHDAQGAALRAVPYRCGDARESAPGPW